MENKENKLYLQRGQTLVEIIVSLGIVLLLISGFIAGGVASIKSSNQSQLRSLAVSYAQEALERTRRERDENWVLFQAKSGLWCLDKEGVWMQGGVSCPVNIDTTFTRGVVFTWNASASRMEVAVTVSWQDGGSMHQSTLTSFFTKWQ